MSKSPRSIVILQEESEVVYGKRLGSGKLALQGLLCEEGPALTDRVVLELDDLKRAFIAATERVLRVALVRGWNSIARELSQKLERMKEPCPPKTKRPAASRSLAEAMSIICPAFPPASEAKIDMEHIVSCHTARGAGVSPCKTVFPPQMGKGRIELAVRRAHRKGWVSRSDERDLRVSYDGGHRGVITMSVDPLAKVIETAYATVELPGRDGAWPLQGPLHASRGRLTAQSADIVVAEDSFDRTRRGGITGVVCVRMDETLFPCVGWRDFVIRLMGQWLKSMARVLWLHDGMLDLSFIDGPFAVFGAHIAEGKMALVGKANCERRWTEFFIVNADGLWHSLIAAARTALQVAATRHWVSHDVIELRRILKTIESLNNR